MTAAKTKEVKEDIVSNDGTVTVEIREVEGVEIATLSFPLTGTRTTDKSVIKASTGGFAYVDGLGFSLNVIESRKKGRVRAS